MNTLITRRRDLDAVATVVIAVLAFVLSYSKLTDLALRAGYTAAMAHLWPLIVDGLAVVATRGVLTLRASRGYAWALLGAATAVSIVAAVAGALLPAGPLPPVAAAAVSVVPPLCLLVAPHLAVMLRRESREDAESAYRAAAPEIVVAEVAAPEAEGATLTGQDPAAVTAVAVEESAAQQPPLDIAPADREAAALQMLADGQLSQREIARRLGVADTTVLRWRRKHAKQQDGGLQLLLEPV